MNYKDWQNEHIARETIEILNEKGYSASYAESVEKAKEMLLGMIPLGSSVAMGGSETLKLMDLIEHFRNGEYRFLDRYQRIPFEETKEIYRQGMVADVLVTGVNAITRQGQLVNVDCSGNRAAGVLFGPKKVIIVTGVNKVVENLDEAMARLKKIAPMNALRNGHKTPCVETGRCMDCCDPQSMCNVVGIVNHGKKFPGRLNVIIIPKELGF